MRIATTGSKGFIGSALVEAGCIPITSDITDYVALREEVANLSPDVIIHAGAKTGVDWCEANEGEAFRVNVRGTSNVDFACRYNGIKLLYLSTCHVFSGNSPRPYKEKSICRPKNVYGFTKWLGEQVCTVDNLSNSKIVRLSSVYSDATVQPVVDELWAGIDREFSTFICRSYTPLWYVVQGLLKMAEQFENAPKIVNLVLNLPGKSEYEFWLSMVNSERIHPRNAELTGMVFRPHNGCLDGKLFHDTFGGLPR